MLIEQNGESSSPATETEVPAGDQVSGQVTEATEGKTPAEGSKPASEKPASSDGKQSESSPDKGAKQELSKQEALRKVVKDAIVKKPADGKGKSPAPEKKGSETDPATDGKDGKQPTEAKVEDKDLPFHNHPRFRQLLRENKEFEADATQHRQVRAFMEQNDLTPEHVRQGFEVMAMLRNPAKLADARQVLATWMDRIDLAMGSKLPDDLQEKVNTGAMDEASAKELAKSRQVTASATHVADNARQAAEQQRQNDHAQACAGAVSKWENDLQAKDPDFAVKQPHVKRAVMLRIKDEGRAPKDTKEAVQWAKDAYEQVSADMAPMLKGRPRVNPVPSQGGKVTVKEQPKTMQEAVALALRGKRAA